MEGEKVEFIVKVETDGRLKASEVTGLNGENFRGQWEEDAVIKTATVARWRGDKGFGFLTPEEGDKDIFVHVNDCGVALVEGTMVEYTEQTGDDGRIKATKVLGVGGRPLVEPAPAAPAGGPMRGMMTQPQRMMMGYRPMQMQQGMVPYGMQAQMMHQGMRPGMMMQQGYGRPTYGRPY